MSSTKFTPTTLLLLICALILQTSLGADPLFHICSSTGGNFTGHSPYESNLKELINSLIYKQDPSSGFGVSTVGQYQNQQAYGLALCRGDHDVSARDCKTCVSEATREILSLCPYNNGTIIWYDSCLFKYFLDTDIFGQIDNTDQFSLLSVQNVSDPVTFNYVTKELLSILAYKASFEPKLYATGELKIESQRRFMAWL